MTEIIDFDGFRPVLNKALSRSDGSKGGRLAYDPILMFKISDNHCVIGGVHVVKRPDHVKGFVIIARRWVVEHTFAWLGRCRRLAKDWEKSIASSEAWLLIASIRRTARKLARMEK